MTQMEAGLTDHIWEVEDLIGIIEAREIAAIEAGKLKRGAYKKRIA